MMENIQIYAQQANCTYIGHKGIFYIFQCQKNHEFHFRKNQYLNYVSKNHDTWCLECFKKSNVYNQIQTIEQNSNCKFILDGEDDEYKFQCNDCNSIRIIKKLSQAVRMNSQCNHCNQINHRLSFDELEKQVKDSGFILIMKPEEYTNNKTIKIECKHGEVMIKSLADIKRNKGCVKYCKTEKRLQTKLQKKNTVK